MDNTTELLVILMEECAEVSQEASKVIRFGNPHTALMKELGDLLCMIRLTQSRFGISDEDLNNYASLKREKLKTFSSLIPK